MHVSFTNQYLGTPRTRSFIAQETTERSTTWIIQPRNNSLVDRAHPVVLGPYYFNSETVWCCRLFSQAVPLCPFKISAISTELWFLQDRAAPHILGAVHSLMDEIFLKSCIWTYIATCWPSKHRDLNPSGHFFCGYRQACVLDFYIDLIAAYTKNEIINKNC